MTVEVLSPPSAGNLHHLGLDYEFDLYLVEIVELVTCCADAAS